MQKQDLNLKSLANRLEKIEKQNKRLKVGGITLIFLLIILSSLGFTISEMATASVSDTVVKASQFHLVDNGKIRAKLTTVYGGPVLFFYDETGKILLNLNVTFGNPMLTLSGKNGKSLIQLGVLDGRIPMIGINDRDGKPRVTLALREDTNEPRIVLLNGKGNAIWEAGAPAIK